MQRIHQAEGIKHHEILKVQHLSIEIIQECNEVKEYYFQTDNAVVADIALNIKSWFCL